MPETDEGSPQPWEYSLYIPNDPRAVTICRRTLRLILAMHGRPHLSEVAELVATELVANAVQHTKGPAALRIRWARGVLRIGVWDADPTPPEAKPLAPALAEAGRGLALVRGCADEWGWYALGPAQLPDSNGKFIWCELTEAA
ncbi:ATP-binding protein [Streptomyces sp. NPDC021622]|uniref:ATP-binding protein n=1 Tax=Streptomyces sp. NPDC021622 TaxID=3155013 RepID=UPI003400868A